MGHFGDVRAAFLVTGLIALTLAGCSSSNKSTPPASTTTTATSTTTVPQTSTSTSSTVPDTSAPTTTPEPVTTSHGPGPRITGFTVSPASPVCNAPTMIQLTWTATGANAVDLSIDGHKFASYLGGTQSHLEYFACDGKPHTYLLTAHSATGTTTATKVVRSTGTG